MPDGHFQMQLRRRLRQPVCPAGAVCQHRRTDGRICGVPLDARGVHAESCAVGHSRTGRHDRLVKWTAAEHRRRTGHTAATEQYVPAWNRTDPETGEVELARLDVATFDAVTRNPIYVDVTVTEAQSTNEARRRARAHRSILRTRRRGARWNRGRAKGGAGGIDLTWRPCTIITEQLVHQCLLFIVIQHGCFTRHPPLNSSDAH